MPKNGNNGLPLPLVKKVIWSGTVEVNGVITQLLDGNNTPGFSGGPAFIKCYKNGQVKWNLIGLVTGYFLQNNVIHYKEGDWTYNENSGIVSCVDISYIKEIMEKLK